MIHDKKIGLKKNFFEFFTLKHREIKIDKNFFADFFKIFNNKL